MPTKAPAKIAAAARSGRPTARARKRSLLPQHIESRQRRLAATIGTAAKQARMRAGYTQVEVAQAIGNTPEVYGRIERGVMMPSVPSLMRLCLTLGSRPDELMGFAPLRSPQEGAQRAGTMSPGMEDTPEARRLFRLLARLDRRRFKLLAQVAASLVTQR